MADVDTNGATPGGKFMFEGLDQIDWTGLGYHVYNGNQEIPNAMRNLLSPDPRIREEARGFLLGWGQEYGSIANTTPHIIPFIFEILNSPDGPGKADLLDHLASVARYIWEVEHLPVHEMRLYIKTYDALKAGLPILIPLLDDASPTVRSAVIDILQYLTDEVETLLPEFKQRLPGEKEEDVQAAFLKGLKFLLGTIGWAQFKLKEQYKVFLNEMIETSSSERIQVAGAQAAVETFEKHFTKEFPEKVANILSNHFWKISQTIDYKKWSEEFDSALLLIKDLARLNAGDRLMEMLQNPQITPVQAHLIVRAILAIYMIYHDNLYWNCHRNYYAEGRELDYVHSYPLAYNLSVDVRNRDHFEHRIRLLEAIVENQKFWEIPTNMISFFIGLPDSREQLRAILNPKQNE